MISFVSNFQKKKKVPRQVLIVGSISPAWWSRIAHILNYNSFRLNSVDFWGHNDVVSDLPPRQNTLNTLETNDDFAPLRTC